MVSGTHASVFNVTGEGMSVKPLADRCSSFSGLWGAADSSLFHSRPVQHHSVFKDMGVHAHYKVNIT